MSLHDKTLMFFRDADLAAAAGTSIVSRLIDLRLNKGTFDDVRVVARLAAPVTAGAVAVALQTSDDGSDWEDLIKREVSAGQTLVAERLPEGHGRYLKMTVSVKAGTALAAATKVFAELTDTIDTETTPKTQEWVGGTPVPKGADDIAAAGDAVRKDVES